MLLKQMHSFDTGASFHHTTVDVSHHHHSVDTNVHTHHHHSNDNIVNSHHHSVIDVPPPAYMPNSTNEVTFYDNDTTKKSTDEMAVERGRFAVLAVVVVIVFLIIVGISSNNSNTNNYPQ